ncbi:ABC transporter F family member 4 isoform X2 [Spodoptera frugiperda]|uniref:ABC transporter F family member 4 isoform X2 n=1 Tax=Spodoptera frugiperda TaxID=7108 RepID=A0A9R0DTV2_SPOFR|nr:ABC transporter F family member 4 isoform X2 [Spodoptera frugiperda]XP_050553049.1 ABC transporter F family member 4 isoform X2 [Spodoptera frugiperda]
MPIGNLSKDTGARRESFRPPWVKEKDVEAPPSWMQKKLKPVETLSKTASIEDAAAAPTTAKPLKPVLKKQSTIRDKSENGVSQPVEEKLVKPSAAKQADQAAKTTEEKPKFTKPTLKSALKSEEKPSNDKIERPTLRSVRTIDDKAKEKSVTIVDKRPEKNGPTKANSTVNDKPVVNNKVTSKDTKPVTKVVNDKPAPKAAAEKPVPKAPEKVVLKPVEKVELKPVPPKEEPKPAPAKQDSKPTKVEPKTPVSKPEPKASEKAVEKSESTDMATKPPLEKTPSKLPPRKPPIQKQPSKDDVPVKKWRDPLHERVKENIDKTLNNEVPKGHTLTKNESLRSLLKPTPPPMPPPMPPKMPPPPEFKKSPLDPEKLKRIEQLRSRPRRRPDWSDMMKEVEQGKKLKHVVCNDRSSPIITRSAVVKNKGQFIFESEKPNSHNALLKEISKGVKLKKTKTNDRSKPNLEGLRKFRRQMTIEEQVQKSMSQANIAASPSGVGLAAAEASNSHIPGILPTEEEDIDEMDDIDKVRDDLQSTKQLLAIELRNKEAQERENKRLLTRIANLEAELARERAFIKQEQHKTVISVTDAYDERLVNSLKMEVEKTKENADNLEKQYLQAAEDRDTALTELEEVKRRNAELEKKLEQAMSGIMPTSMGSRRSSHAIKQLSVTKDDSFEEEEESDEEEEESEEKKQKRMEKEVRNMRNKIRYLKEKQDHMKRERMGFKMSLKNQQAALKEEKRKYKELKREVDKMAAMMKECGSDDEDDEEEEEESEEEKKSESEEEETETETEQDTESETESESEPEDAPLPKKKENLTKRVKRHETRVHALKKGNALLMANVDRLKDDVLKQREESVTLQKELDSLIDDLE